MLSGWACSWQRAQHAQGQLLHIYLHSFVESKLSDVHKILIVAASVSSMTAAAISRASLTSRAHSLDPPRLLAVSICRQRLDPCGAIEEDLGTGVNSACMFSLLIDLAIAASVLKPMGDL